MPGINIKSNAGAVGPNTKTGPADNPMKSAFDKFLNSPTLGNWDQFQRQASSQAPWIGYNNYSPESAYAKASAAYDEETLRGILSGKSKKKRIAPLPPNFTAMSYNSSQELGGIPSLSTGARAFANIPSSYAMAGILSNGISKLNAGVYPQGALNAIRNQSSYVNRLISGQDRWALSGGNRQTGTDLVRATGTSMVRATGTSLVPFSDDSSRQLAKIANIVAKQYELERYSVQRMGGSARLGYSGALALEGIPVPFRDVPRNRQIGGGSRLLLNYEGKMAAYTGDYTTWRDAPPLIGRSGWPGYTQAGIGGAGAGPWSSSWSGYGYGAGGPPLGGIGIPPVPPGTPTSYYTHPGGRPRPPRPPPPGGGGLPPRPPPPGGGGLPPWFSSGARWGFGGALSVDPLLNAIYNQSKPSFEYVKNMFGLARAGGGDYGAGVEASQALWPAMQNKGRHLAPWQITYGVGPLESSRMLKNFPILQDREDMDRTAYGLAKSPYLAGFSHIDSESVRGQLGYIAAAFPRGLEQDPLRMGARLAPILAGVSNLPQQALFDSARSIMEMQIGAGGIAVSPEDIYSKVANMGATNTPGARLGITQQNYFGLQNAAVENIGSSPMQTLSSIKVAQDLKSKGIKEVIGEDAFEKLSSNKVGRRYIDDMNIALNSGNMAAVMGLMPSFLQVAGSQSLLTGASNDIANNMFPGAANQPMRDLIAGNLAGMGGTNLSTYMTGQLAPGGTLQPFNAANLASANYNMSTGHIDPSIRSLVMGLSAEGGVDPNLVMAIMQRESGFDPTSKSSAGAVGLMQVIPTKEKGFTAKDVSSNLGNIRAGIKRLKEYYYGPAGGDLSKALAMYNVGPTGYQNPAKAVIGDKYAKNVLSTYRDYQQEAGIYTTPGGLPSPVLGTEAAQAEKNLEVSNFFSEISSYLGAAANNLLNAKQIMDQKSSSSPLTSMKIPNNMPGGFAGIRGR